MSAQLYMHTPKPDPAKRKTYSCVHWLRTKRNVIEDFPHPPSPQTVIVTRCESSMLTEVFQKGVL